MNVCNVSGILLTTVGLDSELFNLTGMASGPVLVSLVYESTGHSFRVPLILMAGGNGAPIG